METETLKIEVRKEPGKGYGLYATEKIFQGETICDLPTGEYMSEPDKYSIQLAPGVHINCSGHPIGATNHSCEPNAAIRGDRMVAWACIDPEDEIFIDYRRTEATLANPFLCTCGTDSCQGWLE